MNKHTTTHSINANKQATCMAKMKRNILVYGTSNTQGHAAVFVYESKDVTQNLDTLWTCSTVVHDWSLTTQMARRSSSHTPLLSYGTVYLQTFDSETVNLVLWNTWRHFFLTAVFIPPMDSFSNASVASRTVLYKCDHNFYYYLCQEELQPTVFVSRLVS